VALFPPAILEAPGSGREIMNRKARLLAREDRKRA